MLERVPPNPTGGGALRDDLVRYFADHRKFVEADALTLLLGSAEPVLLSRQLIDSIGTGVPFVTRAMVESLLGAEAARTSRYRAPPLEAAGPIAPAAAYALIAEGFGTAPPHREPLEAYGGLFASRFRALQRMLKGRPDLPHLVPVRELRAQEGSASIIGMIREVRQTAEHKHLILGVEDDTGMVEILLPRDRPAAKMSWLLDEVVGVNLSIPRERGRIPLATSVHRPDIPALRAPRRSSGPHRVLFLSDLHIGSKSFLQESWQELMAFLRGQGPAPEIAREIDHVVIAGDLVDGIGIYPDQESDLAIHDVFEQYAELGRRLKEVPERLNIIAVPGNHDAVCPAEPQPALPPAVRGLLPENVRLLGNPSTFALEGVVIEAYHGRSFDDLIPAIAGASYARPTEVMKTMLAMRHLAPIYGGRTPLAPLVRDGMVVDPVPDILVTGHAHTYGADQYRGVLLLNASTWQAETSYQRMRNITPVPARAAVVNLMDLTLEALDFERPRPAVVAGATAR
jgi:DNA polymerase II small subunit